MSEPYIEGRFVCSNCLQQWIGVRHRVPWNDNDSKVCTCGEPLHTWRGGETWTFRTTGSLKARPVADDGIPL